MGDTSSDATWMLYRYNPSLAAAVVLAILFLLTTLLHLFQLLRTRTWYFIPFVIGGLFECIGYIARAASAQQSPNWTLGPYIMQSLLLLLAPILFAASIYMGLGRIILLADGERHSIIKQKWLTKTFVAGDVFSFFIQSGGGGIMAGGSISRMHLGEKIIIGGLILQMLFFALFIFNVVVFDHRMRRTSRQLQTVPQKQPWRKHLEVLFAASILILIRSIFRVVEYIQGNAGYLLRHEIFLYIFDGALMFTVMLLFNIFHPSEVKALLQGGKWSKEV